jgi:uncharacterized protein
MEIDVAGREDEKKQLREAFLSGQSHFISVYGRRRVGKTFLIRAVFEKEMTFEFTGIHEAELPVQLAHFTESLNKLIKSKSSIPIPKNWIGAFQQLTQYLEKLKPAKKKVIFFDELPWICAPRSGFLSALEHFWNSWASKRKDIVLVVCGSAASWMIKNIVRNKGGLHNRITSQIRLMPFTLAETESFLKKSNVNLDRYQIIQLYMAMGGIPHYLKEARPGMSAAQIIDATCFSPSGLLKDEFISLFRALFDEASGHISIVRALAKKDMGITRNEVMAKTGLSNAGSTTRLLDELVESGFVTRYMPFGKKERESLFRLTDLYSIFYLHFIEKTKSQGKGSWMKQTLLPSYKAWSGYAFENICLLHVEEIKKALGVSGVYTEQSSWINTKKNKLPGAQIDLLIDRQDFVINLCEMKYSQAPFVVSKKYATELQQKINVFRAATGTRKSIFLTMLTTFGVEKNQHSIGLVQNEVKMGALFEER